MTLNGNSENAADQLVTFSIDKEEFSFPIQSVQEVVRLPEITPVPGAPYSVKGIMNLRGNVLPLIDLRRRFDLAEVPPTEDTRVVVLRNQDVITGMIVDKVNEVLQVDQENLVPPPPTLDSVKAEWLKGLARLEEGKRVVMVLSEEKLLPEAEKVSNLLEGQGTASIEDSSLLSEREEADRGEERLFVSFVLDGEEFAVNITDVREIVRIGEIIHVPQMPSFVVGVMSLRGTLLPVIDLKKKFDQFSVEEEEKEAAEAKRIIVVDLKDVVTGLLVDSVSEVLRLSEHAIDLPPEVLSASDRFIQGIGKVKKADRLVMLLDLSEFLSGEEREVIVDAVGVRYEKGEKEMMQHKNTGEEKHLVCFRIAGEEFGIDIMQVREIIRLEAITSVPGAPPFVSGIVNLRGNVLPVIDLRERFGYEPGTRSEQNRILVVDIDGKTTGLIVDAVSEVLRIPERDIDPTPPILSASSAGRFLTGVGKLNDGERTVILVDTEAILSLGERKTEETVSEKKEKERKEREAEIVEQHEKSDPESGRFEKEERNEEKGVQAAVQQPKIFSEEEETVESDEAAIIESTIENTETSPKKGDTAQAETQIQFLMSMKKDELLEKAKEKGLSVTRKMTKKEIVEKIAQES